MEPKNDGGPYHTLILPTKAVNGVVTENNVHPGASLRDHFAGLAMQGIVSSISSEDDYKRIKSLGRSVGLHASQWIARDAYKQADAMLAERERGR